jgi:hypothetical protein
MVVLDTGVQVPMDPMVQGHHLEELTDISGGIVVSELCLLYRESKK